MELRVPIFQPVYRNVHGDELSDQNHLLMDGYLDERGYTNRRPGLSSFLDLGLGANNAVSGLFWWSQKGYAIAVSAGNIYKVEFTAGVASKTDLTGDALTSGQPVTFATDGTYVFIAADGRVVYTNGTASTAYLADADAPTTVSHVAYLDGYILANKVNSNTCYFSQVNDSLDWPALSFFSAAGDPDYVDALEVLNREILLLGPETMEVWENDGETPFSRVPGGFIQRGCIAPASIARIEDSLSGLIVSATLSALLAGSVGSKEFPLLTTKKSLR